MVNSKKKYDVLHKNGRNRFAKLTCFALSMVILSGMIGCTHKNKGSADTSSNPSVNSSLDTVVSSDMPHYSAQNLDFYEEEGVVDISFQDGTLTKDGWALRIQVRSAMPSDSPAADNESYSEMITKNVILFYDSTGLQTGQVDLSGILPSDVLVASMTSNPDGIIFLLASTPSEMNAGKYSVYSLDFSGTLLGEPVKIELPTTAYFCQMVVDGAGNMYIAGDEYCGVYSLSGDLLYKVEDPILQGQIFRVGDKVYTGTTRNAENKYLLYPLDNTTKDLGDPIDISQYASGQLSSDGKSLYVTSLTGIDAFDLGSKEKTPLFSWGNIDFISAGSMNELIALSDTTILCLSTSVGSFGTLTMYLFTQDKSNPDAGKTVLTIAGLNITNEIVLQTAIAAFNQSSTEYKVVMKDYAEDIDIATDATMDEREAAMTQMISQINLDILSGKGPDIIYGNYYMPLSAYEDNGVLADLNTWIEKDSAFNKADYLENIFSLCERDGHLYKIPAGFWVWGMYGPKSIIGDRSGWTVDEFETMTASLPETILPMPVQPWSQLLKDALSSSLGTFVDESTGQVNFDVSSFYQILDYAKTYGCSDDASDQPMTTDPYALMRSGGLALLFSQMYGPMYYLEEETYAGGPISVIGYPSPDQNGPVCYISTMLAISEQSSHKDAAWEFIKICLGEDVQQAVSERVIPVLKTQFEAQIEKAINPNGDPDFLNFSEIELDPMTEEQAQAYRDLIGGLDTLANQDQEIMSIILEEAPAYFYDQKSAEDVAALIQNRVQTLVDERG